jgi:hypothetical protein
MSHEFTGAEHDGIGVLFFLVIGEPGRGTRLHKHKLRRDRLCDQWTREVDRW